MNRLLRLAVIGAATLVAPVVAGQDKPEPKPEQPSKTASKKAPKKAAPIAIAVKQAITPGADGKGAILLIENGVITKVGRTAPPKGAVKVSLTTAWATPGVVDAVTRAGASSELWESSAAFMPELRAADALDPWSREVRALGRAGVTSFGLTPRPENVAGGFAAACRALAGTSDAAPAAQVALEEALAVFSLTRAAMRTSRFPGSRMGAVPALRAALQAGREPNAPMVEIRESGRDAKLVRAALGRVVASERALIYAQTSDEIDAALTFAQWFPQGLTICFPTEAHRRVQALGAAKARVVLPAPRAGATTRELELPARLHAAGARVVFASNAPNGRPGGLWLGAALAHAAGLPAGAAIASVTSEPAALLGLDTQTGTIAPGKRADLLFFAGDPLSGSAQLIGVMAGGRWLLKPPGVK